MDLPMIVLHFSDMQLMGPTWYTVMVTVDSNYLPYHVLMIIDKFGGP